MSETYRKRKDGDSLKENDFRKEKSGLRKEPKMKPFVKSRDRI